MEKRNKSNAVTKLKSHPDCFSSLNFFASTVHAQREKCPNTEFFLVRIQSECGKIWTRKNSIFGHFSRCVLADSVEDFPSFSFLTELYKRLGMTGI